MSIDLLADTKVHQSAAWFGSLVNGPIVDRFGRKWSVNVAVVVFVVGSAIQCGAINGSMLFVGKFLSGWLAVGIVDGC